ncbi:hypothetical protein HER10_EVM0012160 [Colletotrichum scovillei]|uniref:Ribosomal protein S2 n=1 Tax=Colletotrichum scovillei TaxID=1209932 RepID=A0A9P7R3V5_9PEZI|nr:uncharacterized protein HER10_EVM0012160 [Colletotrichum scovillei]KAF4782427.1 hypothetical protein HER10_EVM0012160 [Colletotrichum scovillei]KAG7049723.1 ribosomal protein S2 [Colletotrichum scovillei]KAG7068757.1 ribosomal protein S2 [Colletotrichum scovillei]KAG7072715.1 ribosomal protein S2 [Colletotrichum scovillei]
MDASVTTPLLHGQSEYHDGHGLPTPASYGQVQDHPAFLRACHSPWRSFSQNHLCWVRGGIVAYLTAVGATVLDYKLRKEESPYSDWRVVFDFSVVTFSLLLAYHAVVLGWTYTHLYHPHIEETSTGWEYWALRTLSLPYDMASLRKQFYFTLFYTITTVFTFMNTVIYWFVTLEHDDKNTGEPPKPQPSGGSAIANMIGDSFASEWTSLEDSHKNGPHEPFTEIFGKGWYKAFVIINLFGITSVVSLIEIFWLNSIKRPFGVGAHTLGVIFFAGLYLGWAAIGKVETGADAFYWLNEKNVGSREAVVASSIGFVILAPIMYAFMYGLVGMRENMARAAHTRRVAAAAAVAGH